MLTAMINWLARALAGLDDWLAPRNEFGLTDAEDAELAALAAGSERGRDVAEEVACHGYGMKTSQFYAFLEKHRIDPR